MDITQISATLGPAAAAILAVTWFVVEVRRRTEPATLSGNGDKPSESKVRLLMAENCQDCKQVADIKAEIEALRREYRADFRAMQSNVAIDIRGVHERLDDILLDRKVH